MNPECESVILKMKENGYTCVLQKGDAVYTSYERGVKPLLRLLDTGADCRDFFAADKVVGKAAAFLYILLRVRSVYADVISAPAYEILVQHGIEVSFGSAVDAIRNRAGTGFCPMESAVWNENDPESALAAIRKKLNELNGG